MVKITRETDIDGWRWYNVDGQKMISVTKVLSVAVHFRLINWFRSQSKAASGKISKEAADLGSKMHELVEEDLQGNSVNIPTSLSKAWDKWLALKDLHKIKALETEKFVYSKKYGYAGQMDSYLQFVIGDAKHAVGDLKTGKYYYENECASQCAAYRQALTEMGDYHLDDMGLVGIHLPVKEESPCEPDIHVKKPYEAQESFERFLNVLETFKWKYEKDIKDKGIDWPYLYRNSIKEYYGGEA